MTDPEAVALAVVADATEAFAGMFHGRLTAVYLLGSLAYGGYSAAVSDIDLAVVLAERHAGDTERVRAIVDDLHSRTPTHGKLSVFWSSLPPLSAGAQDGRFPAIDRRQLADHGRLLWGTDIKARVASIPSEALLMDSVRFAIEMLATDEAVSEFRRPRRLLADPVWFTKAALFPARFLHTATETPGRSSTNDEAIAWYLRQSAPVGADLVRLAARVRAGRPLDPAEAAAELDVGLLPLYQHFIDDHTDRLRRAGAPPDLTAAFTRWGERLAS